MNITFYPNTTTASSVDDYEYEYLDIPDGFGICDYEPHGSKFLPALYSFIFLLGLLGNTRVLWVILKKPRVCDTTDMCLLNLAVADLLLACSLPFLAHQARDQWIFGEAMCKTVLGAYYFGFYGSIFFITLMSMDRYLAIAHPMFARGARTRTHGAVAATITWVAAFLASFPEVLYLKVWEHKGQTFCLSVEPDHTDSIRIFALFKGNVLGLLIPLAIMGFCYTMLVRTLLIGPPMMTPPNNNLKPAVIRLVVVAVVVFFCCWTPYNITIFLKALAMCKEQFDCEYSKVILLTLQVTETLAYFHSCINPIIYMIVSPRFRIRLGRPIWTSLPQERAPQSTQIEELSITKS